MYLNFNNRKMYVKLFMKKLFRIITDKGFIFIHLPQISSV